MGPQQYRTILPNKAIGTSALLSLRRCPSRGCLGAEPQPLFGSASTPFYHLNAPALVLCARDSVCKPRGGTHLKKGSCGLIPSPWDRDSGRSEWPH